MTTSDIINVVAAAISGVAVVISVVALVLGGLANRKANRNTQRSNETQERLLEIEQQRDEDKARQRRQANVAVVLESTFDSRGGKNWRLKLVNTGNAEARRIEVTLDGTSIRKIGSILTDKGIDEVVLGAGNSCGWPAAICSGFHPPWNVVVTWEDESGLPGQYRTTLTF